MLTQSRLKEVLDYNPITGIFTKVSKIDNKGRNRGGFIVGSNHAKGYLTCSLDNKQYLLHRLAVLFMTGIMPETQVDHINHVKTDNRWINIRLTDNQENHKNTPLFSNNKSGFNGVCWYKNYNKWRAYIKVNGKQITIGYFENKDDAITARALANKDNNFHLNHGLKTKAVKYYLIKLKQ